MTQINMKDSEEYFDMDSFFRKFGDKLAKVNSDDDTETGWFRLFSPEESDRAQQYLDDGYYIASIYDYYNEKDDTWEEYVKIDNDTGDSHHKTGFFVLYKDPPFTDF